MQYRCSTTWQYKGGCPPSSIWPVLSSRFSYCFSSEGGTRVGDRCPCHSHPSLSSAWLNSKHRRTREWTRLAESRSCSKTMCLGSDELNDFVRQCWYCWYILRSHLWMHTSSRKLCMLLGCHAESSILLSAKGQVVESYWQHTRRSYAEFGRRRKKSGFATLGKVRLREWLCIWLSLKWQHNLYIYIYMPTSLCTNRVTLIQWLYYNIPLPTKNCAQQLHDSVVTVFSGWSVLIPSPWSPHKGPSLPPRLGHCSDHSRGAWAWDSPL